MSVDPWGDVWKHPDFEKLDFIPSELSNLPDNSGSALFHDCRVLVDRMVSSIMPHFDGAAETLVNYDTAVGVTTSMRAARVVQYRDGTTRGIWLIEDGSFIEASYVGRCESGRASGLKDICREDKIWAKRIFGEFLKKLSVVHEYAIDTHDRHSKDLQESHRVVKELIDALRSPVPPGLTSNT